VSASRPRRSPARVLLVVGVAALAGLLLAGPVLGWFDQRDQVAEQQAELGRLTAENNELIARRTRFDDPAEVRRIASRDLGLVEPGEESYAVLPTSTAGVNLPNGWPFDLIASSVATASQ